MAKNFYPDVFKNVKIKSINLKKITVFFSGIYLVFYNQMSSQKYMYVFFSLAKKLKIDIKKIKITIPHGCS